MKRVVILSGLVAVAAVPLAADASHRPGHRDTALNLGATPNPVVYGSTTTLSGRLTGPGHAGRSIDLQSDPFPFDAFANDGANTTTNNAGNYSFTRRPLVNTRYRARRGPTISSNVTVLVRSRVSLNVSDSTPASGQLVRFSGRACPEHDGLAVAIQRRSSSGRFRTVRRTTLRAAARCSIYSRRFRVFRDGVFRAVVAAHTDHARGLSRRRGLNAH
jgi:hypothetical protein